MTKTIGDGWSDDPSVKRVQIAEQEALVTALAQIMEEFPEDELEMYAKERAESKATKVADGYSGFHNRTEVDYNGWYYFEVYHRNGNWFWSACDHGGEHKGFEAGPFSSSKDAYYNGREG